MYIATVPNRSSPPAILLREAFRENGKVKNRTLANLSHWPAARIEALRRALRGDFDHAAVSQPMLGLFSCLFLMPGPFGASRLSFIGRAVGPGSRRGGSAGSARLR